jgi:hypothetical protein
MNPKECKDFIDKCTLQIAKFGYLIYPNLIKFYIENPFQFLPSSWQELTNETTETLIKMASTGYTKPDWDPELVKYVKTPLKINRIPQEKETYKLDNEITVGMDPKKRLEVKEFSGFIDKIAKSNQITLIVDLGAGQGYLDQCLSYQYNYIVVAVDDSLSQTNAAKRHNSQIQKSSKYKSKQCKLYHIHESINIGDDLNEMIQKIPNIPYQMNSKWLLCGLHTCGDLAVSTIKQFLMSDATCMVNIGCCYQHLTENDTRKSTFHHSNEARELGFPLSNYLKQKNIILDYSCRMLACQTPFNWIKNIKQSEMQFRDRSWRAKLQLMLTDNYDCSVVDPTNIPIGRLPQKAFQNGFVEYAHHAIRKLGIPYPTDTFNDSIIQQYENIDIKEFIVYWCLRVILSETIESLILVDRVLYLYENGCKVELKTIFDMEVSPRNIAIVAYK